MEEVEDVPKNDHISTEVMIELKENYLLAKQLLNDDKPENTEPFKNKYAALELLRKSENLVYNSIDNSKLQEISVCSIIALILLQEGIISIDTEELKSGEEYLVRCIDALNGHTIKPQIVTISISALNQLGILWSKRDQASKAKEYLKLSENIYTTFKEQYQDSDVISISSLLGIKENELQPAELLERVHTLTLYYLAQIYGSLEDFIQSAIYCHITLKRQLEYNDFDSIDWSLNAATLSQFFMEKELFSLARHHLSAATYILGIYEDSLSKMNHPTDEDKESKLEEFKHRSADVARCWAKYGILLLSMSRERLIKRIESQKEIEDTDKNDIESHSHKIHDINSLKNLTFTSIESDIGHVSSSITDQYILDFNDAKLVFLNVKKWLDDAKLYYTLQDHASDYVQIIQDMSQAYKYLAFFEENEDRQAKMHKRRIDLLEDVKKELNENYYKSVCREIWIELGETYSELLDIKLDRLKMQDERPSPSILSKINKLTESAISNFKNFLDSITLSENDKIHDDLLRPALCAYFHLGRLYNKFITFDKTLQLEHVKKSLEAYTFLVNYCEKNIKAQELMVEELSICKDFIKLLPIKVSKLNEEIINSS